MTNQINQGNSEEEKLDVGLQILSFCIPLAGGIIYFVNINKSPKKAKMACHAALWGIGIGIVLQIFATIAAGS